jgi:SWI/SNF-related matrix-associated actin-dependent regulator 1 of chromatin subfamily A
VIPKLDPDGRHSNVKNSETLYQYQTDGIETLHRMLTTRADRAALLADPPGAGKTPQALGVAEMLEAKSVIIVCPASLKENWRREVQRWSHFERITVCRDNRTIIHPELDGVVILSSGLSLSTNIARQIVGRRWDFLIIDEAHCAKNPTSQTSRMLLVSYWAQCRYRLLITGTPLPNGRASEAWTMFSRLDREEFGNWKNFAEKYCIEEVGKYGKEYKRSRNLPELRKIAEDRFMVRRTKEEVRKLLPGIVRQNIFVELPGKEAMAAENNIDVDAILTAIEMGYPLESDHIATARKKIAELKAPLVFQRVMDLLDEVDQLVVFLHHKNMYEHVSTRLEAAGIPWVGVSGATHPHERMVAVDMFQTNKARVFLGSIRAASTGLTLTAASTLLMAEYDWVPSINEQAEGRIYRLTQTEICRVQYLVAKDTLDEKVLKAVQRKQKDIELILGS